MSLLLLACVRPVAYMPPPPELAGVADIWMPADAGPGGLPARIGDWVVNEASCEPSVVNNGSLGAMEWIDRQDICNVTVTGASAVRWTSECLRRVKTTGKRVGADSVFANSHSDTLHCTIRSETDRWEMDLSGGFSDGWAGTLRQNGQSYSVESVRKVSGQDTPSSRLTGLLFLDQTQPKAAMDLLKAGVYWVDPSLNASSLGATLSGGLVVLLYAGREYAMTEAQP